MDRGIVYPGQIPLDTDLLSVNHNTMIALGYALRATLGTGVYADGLACLPTVPASMQVNIGPGSFVTTSIIDASAYGTIAADLIDPLVKMGINPYDSTSFTLSAPGTSGQTINYLIEAQLVEADGLPISLPYYNAAQPSQPFTGPNNNQAEQNTVRTQRVGLQLKAGAPAAAGTQQTPGVDAGWSGLYVITVNFAQTTVTAPSIAVYPGAPFIGAKIPALAPLLSPTFQGSPTAPTPPSGDVSQRLVTTNFLRGFGHVPNLAAFPVNGSFTVPTGVTTLKVTVIGGGASGGGTAATGATTLSLAAGGNSGTICIGTVTVTPGQVYPITVATAALWNIAGFSTGGGTSTFGSILSAPGGLGGLGNVPAIVPPLVQAALPQTHTASGGTFNMVEIQGGFSSGTAVGNFISGKGADLPGWGAGGGGVSTLAAGASVNGIQGFGFGSGGGGAAASTNAAAKAGGPGAPGLVVVEW